MKKEYRISDCELEIMRVVWQNKGPVKSADILKVLRQTSPWEDNTIYTMIGRLVKKGFLSKEKEKQAVYYTATVSEEDYIREETQNFVDKMFLGNAGQLVNMLFQNKAIQTDELEYLRRLWEEEGHE